MCGRFLLVRPSEPQTTAPIRKDNSVMAVRSKNPYGTLPMYNGMLYQRGSRNNLPRDGKSPTGQRSISDPIYQSQKTNERRQNYSSDVAYGSHHENEKQKTEEIFDNARKDQSSIHAVKKPSVAGSGSPVKKKKKQKQPSPVKIPRSESINISSPQQPKDPKEIPKKEVDELILEASEAVAHEASQSNPSANSGDAKVLHTRPPIQMPLEDGIASSSLANSLKKHQTPDLERQRIGSIQPVVLGGGRWI